MIFKVITQQTGTAVQNVLIKMKNSNIKETEYPEDIENVFINVQIDDEHIIVGDVYRIGCTSDVSDYLTFKSKEHYEEIFIGGIRTLYNIKDLEELLV